MELNIAVEFSDAPSPRFKNEGEWTNCRKFGADTDITYTDAESTVEYK